MIDMENGDYPTKKDFKQAKIRQFAFIIALFSALFISAEIVAVDFCRKSEIADIDIEQKINPNCDGIESLIRLPAVGPVMAAGIIEYRQQFVIENRCQAFDDINDLQNVCRIGPKRAVALKKYLEFK